MVPAAAEGVQQEYAELEDGAADLAAGSKQVRSLLCAPC
jgi:hypothetical protein